MKRNDEDLVILDYNNSTVHFYKVGADTDITEAKANSLQCSLRYTVPNSKVQ